jgi:hypothetical protein
MNRFILGIFLISLISPMYSCKTKDDASSTIKPEKMREVLWEYLQIQHYAQEVLSKDSTINDTLAFLQLRDSMFRRHQVDARNFKKSMLHYRTHPDQFLPLLDSIAAMQQRNIKSQQPKKQFDLEILELY